uniref:Uncharacterized protein n=1 Tax=Daphnia galeata TaxID=27404 RepID=A0A8J2WGP4_9CRUS|nr:unnamed protein product [Daphnia galeata]
MYKFVIKNFDLVKSALEHSDLPRWEKLKKKHIEVFFESLNLVLLHHPDQDDAGFFLRDFKKVSTMDTYYLDFPGYAKYRDFFDIFNARFLWFLDSAGQDIFFPEEGKALFLKERLASHDEDRLIRKEIQYRLHEENSRNQENNL